MDYPCRSSGSYKLQNSSSPTVLRKAKARHLPLMPEALVLIPNHGKCVSAEMNLFGPSKPFKRVSNGYPRPTVM